MKKLFILFITAFLFSACNHPRQIAVNKLEGSWKVESVTVLEEGSFEVPQSGTMFFSSCDVERKRSTFCEATMTLGDMDEVMFEYNMEEQPGDSEVFFTQFGDSDNRQNGMYWFVGAVKPEYLDDNVKLTASLRKEEENTEGQKSPKVEILLVPAE